MEITRVALDELHQDPANARSHDDINLAAIEGSLARFGQAEPLVVQQATKRVIGGNGRVAAMRKLGWTEADVVLLDVDYLQATALGIALNRTAELADWDEQTLAKLLGQLREDDALDGVGFDDEEIDALIASIDEGLGDELDDPGAQEPPENPVSRTGDLWLLGDHRLLCGDSTSPADVTRLLADATPGLMVTDPPYGVSYRPQWRRDAGLTDGGKTAEIENDDRVDWTAAWDLFPGDVCYVWHAGVHSAAKASQLARAGFEIRSQIIWSKTRFAISRGHYHWKHEPCWYAVRAGKTASWAGDRKQTTVWDLDHAREDVTEHSTQKPLEAMLRPLRNHDIVDVYEPFSGSGTTVMAAEQAGRRCFSMEQSPPFVDAAITRWQAATGESAVLDGDGRTFQDVSAERLS